MESVDSDSSFTPALNRRKRKIKTSPAAKVSESDSEDSQSFKKPPTPKASRKKTKTKTNNVETNSPNLIASESEVPKETPRPQPQQKIPPITVYKSDSRFLDLLNNFSDLFSPVGVVAKKVPEGIKIFTTSHKDYVNLQKFLDSKKVPYHLVVGSLNKTFKIVIRNLDEDFKSDEVLGALNNLKFPAIRVAQLTSKVSKKKLPIFLVELKDTPEGQAIFNLKSLLFMKINVQPYVPPNTPVQCHRCQRFGHVTKGCNATPRCVKCSGEHYASECVVTKENFNCALCSSTHTASYRGCCAYKAVVAARKARVNNLTSAVPPTKPNRDFREVRQGVSFASIAGTNSRSEQPAPSESSPAPTPAEISPLPTATVSVPPPKAQRPPKQKKANAPVPNSAPAPPAPSNPEPNHRVPVTSPIPKPVTSQGWKESLLPFIKMVNPGFTWDSFFAALLPVALSIIGSGDISLANIMNSLLPLIFPTSCHGY